MDHTTIKVGGMSCQGCVKSVTRVLQELPGVQKAEVSLDRGEASVDYESSKVAIDRLRQAIRDAGFEAA